MRREGLCQQRGGGVGGGYMKEGQAGDGCTVRD